MKTAVVVSGLVAVSLVFMFSYDFITQWSYYRAKKINVLGAQRLTPEQVLEQVGIARDTNILAVNLTTARKRLLAHPWIAEAEISRELPDQLTLRITEHQPLAVLDMGRKFLVNSHGEIFKEWDDSIRDNLPVIQGLTFSDLNAPGEPQSIPFTAVMEILALGQKPDSVLPNRIIKKIQVDREIGVTLYAFDETKVIKIGYQDYPRKYDRLKEILFHMDRKRFFSNIESIDLKSLHRIVVNPHKTQAPGQNAKEA
ncbi:MAG: FtsQ-type POTRA domain-containing protein [Desulfobacterales bacterium]|nr:FtsQ-type POTRA domain-containing protein [Desulfobacterales bacterium]